jgi:hypothetical protein
MSVDRKSKFGLRHAININESSISFIGCNKAQLALLHDEVRILIFDDPAEQEERKHTKFCFSQLNSIDIILVLRQVYFTSQSFHHDFTA